MFHIYIIEDNNLFSKSIKNMIQDYAKSSSEFCIQSIKTVHDSFSEFLESIHTSSSKNNIYIIDIDLNDSINGLQLAKSIRSFDFDGYIIFLTGHIEMTAVTFHYNLKALNFIYKGYPNLQQLLFNSLDQIVLETSKERKKQAIEISAEDNIAYFSYSYKSNFYKIPYDDIIYIETHGLKRRLILHTLNKTYECSKTINSILSELPATFIQCHRSYVVNTKHIQEIKLLNNQYIVLFNKDFHCYASKKYLSTLLEHMQLYK